MFSCRYIHKGAEDVDDVGKEGEVKVSDDLGYDGMDLRELFLCDESLLDAPLDGLFVDGAGPVIGFHEFGDGGKVLYGLCLAVSEGYHPVTYLAE